MEALQARVEVLERASSSQTSRADLADADRRAIHQRLGTMEDRFVQSSRAAEAQAAASRKNNIRVVGIEERFVKRGVAGLSYAEKRAGQIDFIRKTLVACGFGPEEAAELMNGISCCFPQESRKTVGLVIGKNTLLVSFVKIDAASSILSRRNVLGTKLINGNKIRLMTDEFVSPP